MSNTKLVNGLILVLGIQLAMVLFLKQTFPLSNFWTLTSNPTDWSATDFLDFVRDMATLTGSGMVLAGLYVYHSDFVTFAGLTTIFLSFGIPLYDFWRWIDGHAIFGDASQIMAIILVSPLIIAYIMSVLYFWRGHD